MTKRIASLTGMCALALGIAAFTGSALAGNGNGNDNGKAANPTAPASAPVSQASAPGNSANAPGQVKTESTGGGSASQNAGAQAGVKPTNATAKGATCKTGGGSGSSATCTPTGTAATNAQSAGKADASKRYGNGKTAAQIANAAGAPAGTTLRGPGNSQPHKAALCPRGKEVDVHALKAKGQQKKCGAASSTKPTTSNKVTSPATVSHGASVHAAGSTKPTTSNRVTTSATVSQGASVHAAGGAPGAVTGAAPSAQGSSPQGGVLGVAYESKPAGGVLGEIASGILPFTGFPLWIAVLVAVGLIVLGLALRRGGRATV